MLGHTYLTKLKSKSFIVTTVIMLIAVILFANIGRIITFFDNDSEKYHLAVIDQTTGVFDLFEQNVGDVTDDMALTKVAETEDVLQKAVNEGTYDGYLILETDKTNVLKGIYKAPSLAQSGRTAELQSALQATKSALAAEQLQLSPEQLESLSSPVLLEKVSLMEHAKSEEELNQARGLVYILLFIIYFAVIFYANTVGIEIANEKSSRVMEILISSVSPTKQMFAKIIGLALVSLTQMALFLGIGYIAISKNFDTLQGGFFDFFGFGETSISSILYAIVFFLLGYLLFATLAAFLGSLVSRTEDAQQMLMPISFILMIGFFIAMYGLSNPESTVVTVTSFIPFFTPMLMFLRVGMLNVPLWETLLSISLMVLTIGILATIGARIYRGGVLMYGHSRSFKDIKKALQLTKNE